MPPKKARDSRRQHREERQQRRNAAQSQPQPNSSSLSAPAAAAEGAPIDGDTDIAQFFLSALLEALQRRPDPSTDANPINPSTRTTPSAATLTTLLAAVLGSRPSSSSAAVSGALDTLLSSLLVAFHHRNNPSRLGAASPSALDAAVLDPSSPSDLRTSSSTSVLDRATTNAGGGLTTVDDQETSSSSSWNVRGLIDDMVSEPSTSGSAATATATSGSRTPQQNYKKLKKALLSKLRKVLEVPTTPKEQQEEVASLVELCLRHIDHQAENGPAPAGPADDDDGAIHDHEEDREGSDDA